MPGMVGCNHLPFDASLSVAPDGQAASTPRGPAARKAKSAKRPVTGCAKAKDKTKKASKRHQGKHAKGKGEKK
jgi:hypothetical protein